LFTIPLPLFFSQYFSLESFLDILFLFLHLFPPQIIHHNIYAIMHVQYTFVRDNMVGQSQK